MNQAQRRLEKIKVAGLRVPSMSANCLPLPARAALFGSEQEMVKTVYADLIGQSGTIINQLLECPPDGYRFVTKNKISTTIAERMHSNVRFREAKRSMQRFLPVNLMTNYFLTRFMKPPVAVDLTYSISTVVFRPEPWVLYLESPNQLAGFNHHG